MNDTPSNASESPSQEPGKEPQKLSGAELARVVVDEALSMVRRIEAGEKNVTKSVWIR